MTWRQRLERGLLLVGILGGTIAGGFALIQTVTANPLEHNGTVTACAVGRTAEALAEVGHSVIPADELERNAQLRAAFDNLDDALAVLDVDANCRRLEDG